MANTRACSSARLGHISDKDAGEGSNPSTLTRHEAGGVWFLAPSWWRALNARPWVSPRAIPLPGPPTPPLDVLRLACPRFETPTADTPHTLAGSAAGG